MDLKETVVITRPVDSRIADLVHFARRFRGTDIDAKTDEEMIAAARDFLDEQHGED